MVDVLKIILGMKSIGGVALPIQDAILVPVSAVRIAANVMTHTFLVKTGLEAVVKTKSLDDVEDQLTTAA